MEILDQQEIAGNELEKGNRIGFKAGAIASAILAILVIATYGIKLLDLSLPLVGILKLSCLSLLILLPSFVAWRLVKKENYQLDYKKAFRVCFDANVVPWLLLYVGVVIANPELVTRKLENGMMIFGAVAIILGLVVGASIFAVLPSAIGALFLRKK